MKKKPRRLVGPKEELEIDQAVDDMFAFFAAHPEWERAFIAGSKTLEETTAAFEKWRQARAARN